MKAMKQIYVVPSLKVIGINASKILSGSVNSNKDIGYGGKDTGGTQTPSSFDFEFEEEEYDEMF